MELKITTKLTWKVALFVFGLTLDILDAAYSFGNYGNDVLYNGVHCFRYIPRYEPRRVKVYLSNTRRPRCVWRTRYYLVLTPIQVCCSCSHGTDSKCIDCNRIRSLNGKLSSQENRLRNNYTIDDKECPSGQPGDKGRTGKIGPRGPKGEPGRHGHRGQKGERGERGPVGFPGPPGQRGLRGQKGNQGPPGRPGRRGQKGVPGRTGPKGDRGRIGPPGPLGRKGNKGVPGSPGESPINRREIQSLIRKINMVESMSKSKGVPGDPGFPGAIGPTGRAGQKGETGKPGRRGFEGQKGNPGAPGIQGLQGLKGEPGKQGVMGRKGTRGLPGRAGARGMEGFPGAMGRDGEKGERGEMGPKGEPGQALTFPITAEEVQDLKNRIQKLENLLSKCCIGGNATTKKEDITENSILSNATSSRPTSAPQQTTVKAGTTTEDIDLGSGEDESENLVILPTPEPLSDTYNCSIKDDVKAYHMFATRLENPPPLPPWKREEILQRLKSQNADCSKQCFTYAISYYESIT